MFDLARWPILLCSLLAVACGDDSGQVSASGSASGISSASASVSASASASASGTDSDSATTSASGASASGTSSTTDDSGTISASGTSTTTGGLKLDVGFETTSGTADTDTGEGCKKVDLLFVIDDSGSMSDQQDKLTEAFPSFMETIDEQLVQMKGVDYRVGVLSTDMAGPDMCILFSCGQGHRGRLQHSSDRLDCDNKPDGRWIDEGPVETVSDQFRCIASMDGGEFNEMPLEALRAGLIDRVEDNEAYNAGFLREDALLVLVLITDEDDQSVMNVPSSWDIFLGPGTPTPVIEYQQLLVDLKGGEKERFVAVAISGSKSSNCGNDDNPLAVKAPRIHQFLELNAPNSYWGNICEEDFTTPLTEALDVIKAGCETFPPV